MSIMISHETITGIFRSNVITGLVHSVGYSLEGE